jgi:hypothetical protein
MVCVGNPTKSGRLQFPYTGTARKRPASKRVGSPRMRFRIKADTMREGGLFIQRLEIR